MGTALIIIFCTTIIAVGVYYGFRKKPNSEEATTKAPFLCRIGLHEEYRYMPKVGDFLGESVACHRCGWGRGSLSDSLWNITPEEVQKGANQQAEIEFGRALGICQKITDRLPKGMMNPMRMAYDILVNSGKFTEEELTPVTASVEQHDKLLAQIERREGDNEAQL